MIEIISSFLLINIKVIVLAVAIELILRLIPTKKSVNILALTARGLAKLAVVLKKIGSVLPENRRKNAK